MCLKNEIYYHFFNFKNETRSMDENQSKTTNSLIENKRKRFKSRCYCDRMARGSGNACACLRCELECCENAESQFRLQGEIY